MADIEHDRLTSAESGTEDKAFDRAIRPKTLAEYVGQPSVKKQMAIFIEAARRRSEEAPGSRAAHASVRRRTTSAFHAERGCKFVCTAWVSHLGR